MITHIVHELSRVQQFGRMSFAELKGLVDDDDLKQSMLEWTRGKNKKWYYLMQDALSSFLNAVSHSMNSAIVLGMNVANILYPRI